MWSSITDNKHLNEELNTIRRRKKSWNATLKIFNYIVCHLADLVYWITNKYTLSHSKYCKKYHSCVLHTFLRKQMHTVDCLPYILVFIILMHDLFLNLFNEGNIEWRDVQVVIGLAQRTLTKLRYKTNWTHRCIINCHKVWLSRIVILPLSR